MKSQLHLFRLLLICLTLSLSSFQDLSAEDHELPEMTLAEAEDFLKENLPEAIDLLEYVRRNEPIEDYREALERAIETVQEYHLLKEHDGSTQANWFLQRVRLELQLEQLALSWHSMEEDDPARDELRERLAGKVTELFDHELQGTLEELKLLRREVQSIEEEVKNLQENRTVLINEELKEILDE